MGIVVFISYSRKDNEIFQIPKFAKELEKRSDIDEVLYYEGIDYKNIVKYMSDNIGRCDVFLSFCSHNALQSKYIEDEWQAAYAEEKTIIPIFVDFQHIPSLIKPYLGVEFKKNEFEENVKETYKVVLKTLGLLDQYRNACKKLIDQGKKASNAKDYEKALSDFKRVAEICDEKPLDLDIFSEVNKLIREIEELKFEEFSEVISFRGAQIPQFEANVLEEIEDQLGIQFSVVNKVERKSKMSFTVENDRVVGIGLFECGLRTLPQSIEQFTSLEVLGLAYNNLESFPEVIMNLSSLKTLYLHGNKLTEIPESIEQLTSLKTLILDDNPIEMLPESIGKLTTLKDLRIQDTNLETLPDSIGNLKSLERLWLNLSKLTTLPKSIGKLKSLKELYLYENKLTSLPDSIGNLTSLEELVLEGNYFATLPESIGNLKSLKTLEIEQKVVDATWDYRRAFTKITQLPESIGNLTSLQKLSLVNNDLKTLPESIGNLTSLETLELYENDIITLPKSIGNLSSLIRLNLWGNTNLKEINFTILSNCKKLEDFHMDDSVTIYWNGSKLPEKDVLPKGLQKYYIDINIREKITPKSSIDDFLKQEGDEYLKYAEYGKAIASYKLFLEKNPNNHETWKNLGNAYFYSEDSRKALECYEKAAEIKPDYHFAWNNIGNIYLTAGKLEKSLQFFHKALKIKQDYPQAWYNMGNAYKELKKLQKAIDCYQKATELKPDYIKAWKNLGIIYENKGEIKKASKFFQKANNLLEEEDALEEQALAELQMELEKLSAKDKKKD